LPPLHADGIGDALLDAAIDREIDGLAVGAREPADLDRDQGVGMAALDADDELVDQRGSLTPPSGPGLSFLSSARFSTFSRSVMERISPTRREISSVRRSES
jgi:hypothetical protein